MFLHVRRDAIDVSLEEAVNAIKARRAEPIGHPRSFAETGRSKRGVFTSVLRSLTERYRSVAGAARFGGTSRNRYRGFGRLRRRVRRLPGSSLQLCSMTIQDCERPLVFDRQQGAEGGT